MFVHIDWDVFRQRVTEKIKPEQIDELIAFYRIIRDSTFKLYDQLGLRYQIIENQASVQESMALLQESMTAHVCGE